MANASRTKGYSLEQEELDKLMGGDITTPRGVRIRRDGGGEEELSIAPSAFFANNLVHISVGMRELPFVIQILPKGLQQNYGAHGLWTGSYGEWQLGITTFHWERNKNGLLAGISKAADAIGARKHLTLQGQASLEGMVEQDGNRYYRVPEDGIAVLSATKEYLVGATTYRNDWFEKAGDLREDVGKVTQALKAHVDDVIGAWSKSSNRTERLISKNMKSSLENRGYVSVDVNLDGPTIF